MYKRVITLAISISILCTTQGQDAVMLLQHVTSAVPFAGSAELIDGIWYLDNYAQKTVDFSTGTGIVASGVCEIGNVTMTAPNVIFIVNDELSVASATVSAALNVFATDTDSKFTVTNGVKATSATFAGVQSFTSTSVDPYARPKNFELNGYFDVANFYSAATVTKLLRNFSLKPTANMYHGGKLASGATVSLNIYDIAGNTLTIPRLLRAAVPVVANGGFISSEAMGCVTTVSSSATTTYVNLDYTDNMDFVMAWTGSGRLEFVPSTTAESVMANNSLMQGYTTLEIRGSGGMALTVPATKILNVYSNVTLRLVAPGKFRCASSVATNVFRSLYFDGVKQAPGTWSNSGPTDYNNSTYITLTSGGVLLILE